MRQDLSNKELYSFGIFGAPLSHYIYLAEYVEKEFQPDIYIFLIVNNDFDESLYESKTIVEGGYQTWKIKENKVKEVKPTNPLELGLKRQIKLLLKKSALIRYMSYNLDLLKAHKRRKIKTVKKGGLIAKDQFENDSLNIKRAVDHSFKEIRELLSPKRVVIVHTATEVNIYRDDPEHQKTDILYKISQRSAEVNGLEYLDLRPYFRDDFKKMGKKFSIPKDGHRNEYGHELTSKILLSELDLDQ